MYSMKSFCRAGRPSTTRLSSILLLNKSTSRISVTGPWISYKSSPRRQRLTCWQPQARTLVSATNENSLSRSTSHIKDFDIHDRVYVVTGGGRGLGLTLAHALAEAGAQVYCLDRLAKPDAHFQTMRDSLVPEVQKSLIYKRVDVTHEPALGKCIAEIGDEHGRLDGLIAAAGIQNATPALDFAPDKIDEMMAVNHKGVFLSAQACARQMIKHKCSGSIVLIGSTSGMGALKGFRSPVYSSSKGAVIQLGRSLAMEWGRIMDGRPIRVNVLSPGNIVTPMVEKDFQSQPELKELWASENMLGRLSAPSEFRGAAIFLLSDASSFMTGANLVIDGGYTAW